LIKGEISEIKRQNTMNEPESGWW